MKICFTDVNVGCRLIYFRFQNLEINKETYDSTSKTGTKRCGGHQESNLNKYPCRNKVLCESYCRLRQIKKKSHNIVLL